MPVSCSTSTCVPLLSQFILISVDVVVTPSDIGCLHLSYRIHAPFPRPSVVSLITMHSTYDDDRRCCSHRYVLALNTVAAVRVLAFLLRDGDGTDALSRPPTASHRYSTKSFRMPI